MSDNTQQIETTGKPFELVPESRMLGRKVGNDSVTGVTIAWRT